MPNNIIQDNINKISILLQAFFNKILFSEPMLPSAPLNDAMSYSLNAGGKRLRPLLTILGYNAIKPYDIDALHPALPFAAGIEMIHTYSLIHDDLPGMDNDDLRRGQPTNHIIFGEGAAILAGDALLTKAFEIFSNKSYFPNISSDNLLKASFTMAKAVGDKGMIAGQYADLISQEDSAGMTERGKGKSSYRGLDLLNYIHNNKTAKLIAASLMCGAILADDEQSALELYKFGLQLGLIFQITDDIIDITSSSEELGKTKGSDQESHKLTYPSLMGIENSRKEALRILNEIALPILDKFPSENIMILNSLAKSIINRRT